MPYTHTFSPIINDCITLSISDLKRYGYLKENNISNGVISWKVRGEVVSSISITANSTQGIPIIEISYRSKGDDYNYKIYLVLIKSNLGKGNIYYFRCPFTNKTCKKLYLLNRRFAHRCYVKTIYESQTWSRKNRNIMRLYDQLENARKSKALIHSKHFKRFYGSKPTKSYINALNHIKNEPNISMSALLHL